MVIGEDENMIIFDSYCNFGKDGADIVRFYIPNDAYIVINPSDEPDRTILRINESENPYELLEDYGVVKKKIDEQLSITSGFMKNINYNNGR